MEKIIRKVNKNKFQQSMTKYQNFHEKHLFLANAYCNYLLMGQKLLY